MKKPTTKIQPNKPPATDLDQKLEQAIAGMSREEVQAKYAYHPVTRAIEVGEALAGKKKSEADAFASIAILAEQIQEVKSGDLSCAEATLTAQANTLDLIFNKLAQRAANAEMLNQYETFMRLALKAQSQCRATYESLAAIKNPRPMAFIKQQNIGMNQQVNNDAAPHAHEKTINPSNELLEVQHGEWLDNRTAGTTISVDKGLEAVGAVDRGQDTGR